LFCFFGLTRHGYGKYVLPDGSVYEGMWREGMVRNLQTLQQLAEVKIWALRILKTQFSFLTDVRSRRFFLERWFDL
jgi:hypothetical protein